MQTKTVINPYTKQRLVFGNDKIITQNFNGKLSEVSLFPLKLKNCIGDRLNIDSDNGGFIINYRDLNGGRARDRAFYLATINKMHKCEQSIGFYMGYIVASDHNTIGCSCQLLNKNKNPFPFLCACEDCLGTTKYTKPCTGCENEELDQRKFLDFKKCELDVNTYNILAKRASFLIKPYSLKISNYEPGKNNKKRFCNSKKAITKSTIKQGFQYQHNPYNY